MRYVAAYLLAALGGNNSPSSADLQKILASVGIEAESEKITKLIGELKGKNLEELMAEGAEKLASVPSGAPVAAAPAAAAAGDSAAAEKKEEKKEESEESDDDMGFGLFD